jgi:hypothetical protein
MKGKKLRCPVERDYIKLLGISQTRLKYSPCVNRLYWSVTPCVQLKQITCAYVFSILLNVEFCLIRRFSVVWISVWLSNGGLGWLTVLVCWLRKVVLALRGCCGEGRRCVARCKGAVTHSEGVVAHYKVEVARCGSCYGSPLGCGGSQRGCDSSQRESVAPHYGCSSLRGCCSIVVHCVDVVAHNEVWIAKDDKA